MTYAAAADLVDRAGIDELLATADRDGDGGIDDAVIAAALASADDDINAYLATRYQIPLSTVPTIVRGWAVSIARYRLHRYGAPDHVVRDYKDALQAVRDAGAGRLAIPDAAGLTPASGGSGGVSAFGELAVFDDRGLAGWR